MLRICDVEGPKKTESVEARLESMEQQVFKCQGMVERGLNANHMMITEFTNKHKIDANDIGKHLSRLYDRIDHLQAQIYDLQNQNWMERTCVYVHRVDKDAFLKGNIDPDPDELDMVFDFCPSYVELLEQVRKDLNWMDPSDVVEFDVGFERVASPIVEASPPHINEEANIEPLSAQQYCIQHEPLLEDNDEHDDDENDGTVLHDNNLGDLDKYNLQETMDHSIPYSCGYASESDDEGPDEEVDEEGFTAKEAEAFTKVLGRDHQTPLFEDLSLANEAVVDGGEGILFGVRPPSHRDKHGKNIILPGSKFQTFLELKMWLDEYSVTHYRPHKVVRSNMKLR
ncbi:hypothetical protein D1007_37438 [Hordeum vulgare]|nr:hypothetical protein D1007_37438 [Hordeum vulgare]